MYLSPSRPQLSRWWFQMRIQREGVTRDRIKGVQHSLCPLFPQKKLIGKSTPVVFFYFTELLK